MWSTISSGRSSSKGRRKSSVAPNGKGLGNANPRERCCFGGQSFFDALKAMVTRFLFLIHALIAVWRVSYVAGSSYWLFAIAFVGLVVETIVVLVVKKGHEWKWFSPCVLCYLLSVVPAIWILENHQIALYMSGTDGNVSVGDYVSEVGTTLLSWGLTDSEWVWALEQSMMILIVVGRWLLPKGELTRDQLSALLLTYVAVTSDIVDFYSIFEEDETLRGNPPFVYTIMAVWSWSLLQFTFVHTATARLLGDEDDDDDEEENENNNDYGEDKLSLKNRCMKGLTNLRHAWLETESWSVLLTMLMQDGPFFIIRLITVVEYHVLSNTNLFFLTKNLLVLTLQTYRLVVLHREHKAEKKRRREERKKFVMRDLYRQAFISSKIKHFQLNPSIKLDMEFDYNDLKNSDTSVTVY